MAVFDITDPETGAVLALEGDAEPSESELTEIFAEHRKRSFPAESVGLSALPPTEAPPVFEGIIPRSKVSKVQPLKAAGEQPYFGAYIAPPEVRREEFKERLFQPAVPLPRLPSVEEAPASALDILVSPPVVKMIFGDKVAAQVGRSVINNVISLPEFFETPAGIFTAGLGALGQAAKTAVSAGFAYDLLKGSLGQFKDLVGNWKTMTPAQRADAVVGIIGGGGLGTMAGVHAARGVARPIIERQAFLGAPPAEAVIPPEVQAQLQYPAVSRTVSAGAPTRAYFEGLPFAPPAEREMVRTAPGVFAGEEVPFDFLGTRGAGPQDYVPPAPGPLDAIPPFRPTPEPSPGVEIPPASPIPPATPIPDIGSTYATRTERQPEYQRTAQGAEIPPQPEEVRGAEGAPDLGRGGVERGTEVQPETPPVAEVKPAKPEPKPDLTGEVAAGDTIVWQPNEQLVKRYGELPVQGIVQDVIRNQEGQIGFNIFTPTADDPTRVVRVWSDRGTVVSREPAKVEERPAGKPAEPETTGGIGGPRRPRTVVEIADEIAARGIDPQASYGEFVKARDLKPEISAAEWMPIYRQSIELARLKKQAEITKRGGVQRAKEVQGEEEVTKTGGVAPVAPPTEPTPVVKPEAQETPAEQRSTFQPKEAKEQKKFLLSEIDKAIAEAPEATPGNRTPELQTEAARLTQTESSQPKRGSYGYTDEDLQKLAADRKEWEARVTAELQDLFQKYNIPSEFPGSAEYRNTLGETTRQYEPEVYDIDRRIGLLREAIEKANQAEIPKVTIEVPGDGVFSIYNTRSALEEFREKAQRFPTTTPRIPQPGKPRVTPTKPAEVGVLDKESAVKAAALFVSNDPARSTLQYLWSDGTQTVATDGRRLILVKTGIGGTKKNPILRTPEGKKADKETVFPTWTQVVPTESSLSTIISDIDTARLFNVLKQGEYATSEKSVSVLLMRNRDGSFALKAESPNVAAYVHNVQDGAKVIAPINPKYLIDAVNAARILGDEKVSILSAFDSPTRISKRGEPPPESTTGWSPIVVRSKGMDAVIMPMRGDDVVGGFLEKSDIEPKRERKTKAVKAEPTAPAPAETRTPAQILGQAANVRIKVDEATFIRVTDEKGRTTDWMPLNQINKASGRNPFSGVDVRKIEFSRKVRDEEKKKWDYVLVKAEPTIDEVSPQKGPSEAYAVQNPNARWHNEFIKFIPANPDAVRDAAVRELGKRMVAKFERRPDLAAIRPVEPALYDDRVAADNGLGAVARENLEAVLGRKIVFVQGEGKLPFDAVALPGDNRHIFIDVNSKDPYVSLLGHEFVHHIEFANKPLYDELVRRLAALSERTPSFLEKLQRWQQAAGIRKEITQKVFDRELLGELFGDSFRDESFWNKMAEKEPGLFAKVAASLMDFIRKLAAKIGVRFQSYDYFSDINAVHDVLADAIVKFIKSPEGKPYAEDPAFSLIRDVAMFPETERVLGTEAARRGLGIGQAEAVTSTKRPLRDALERWRAAAGMTGRVDPAQRWERDIARRAVANSLVRRLGKDLALLDQSQGQMGGLVESFRSVKNNPDSTQREISNAAGNALTGIHNWERRRATWLLAYQKQRAILAEKVRKAFGPESIALERADRANTLLEDLMEIGGQVSRQTRDAATREAYQYILQSGATGATRNVLDFIVRNNVDVTGAVLPVMVRERLERAAGAASNTADFAQRVGAGQREVDAVVRIIAESEQIRDRLVEAQEVTEGIAGRQPTAEAAREIAAALSGGDYERALELFGRGVRDVSSERALARYRVNFYARRTRAALTGIRALDEVKSLVDALDADPAYLAERRDVMSELAVRDIQLKANGVELTLEPVREGGKPLVISEGNDPAVQKEMIDQIKQYREEAMAAIADFRNNPDSTESPAKIAGLEAQLPMLENLLDPSMRPGAERHIRSKIYYGGPRTILGWLGRPEITPRWALEGGAGPGFTRADTTLSAVRDVREQHSRLASQHVPHMQVALAKALDSHKGMLLEEYETKIWNPLLASSQARMDVRPLREGMPVGNGEVVTKADIDYLRQYQQFENDLYSTLNNIGKVRFETLRHVLSGVVLDQQGRIRLPFSYGENTVSRRFPPSETMHDWLDRWSKADSPEKKAAMLDQDFDRFVLGYVNGVYAVDWATKFKYNYQTELKAIINEFASKPLESFEDLADRVYQERLKKLPSGTTISFEDVRNDLLAEFGSVFNRLRVYDSLSKAKKEKTDINVWGGNTSFNTARGNVVMPPGWYDYGGVGVSEWSTMIRETSMPFDRAHLIAVEQLVNRLRAVVRQMQDEFKGVPETEIAKRTMEQRRAGDRIYSYAEAQDLLKELTVYYEKFDRLLANAPKMLATDRPFMLLTSGPWQVAISSALMTPPTMIRNLGGGFIQAVLFDRAYRQHNWMRASAEMMIRAVPDTYREILTRLSQVGSPEGKRLYDLLNDQRSKKVIGALAEFFLRDIDYQKRLQRLAEDRALSLNRNMTKKMESYLRFAPTGGIATTQPERGTLRKAAGVGQAATRVMGELFGQSGVGYADSFINRHAIAMAERLEDGYQLLAQKYAPAIEEYARAQGRDPFDWTNPANQMPNQVFGGDKPALMTRDLFRRSMGINIDRALMDYYRRFKAAQEKEKAEGKEPGTYTEQEKLFTDEQRNELFMATADDINLATFANRPITTKIARLNQTLGVFLGYRAWQYHKYGTLMSMLSNKTWLRSVGTNIPWIIGTAAAIALINSMTQEGAEQAKNLLMGKYSAYPTVGKARSPESLTRAIAAALSSEFPIYGQAAWSMFDLGYQRGFSLESQLFAFGAMMDLIDMGKEMVQSGNVAMPPLKYANRYVAPFNLAGQYLPALNGTRQLSNTRNILESAARAVGDNEMLKTKPTVFETKYDELTPPLNRAINALGNGNFDAFQSNVDQMRQVLTEKGDTNPDSTIRKRLQSRNPVANIFKQRPTAEKLQQYLNAVPATQRQQVNETLRNYERALQSIGATPSFTQEGVVSARGGGFSGTGTFAAPRRVSFGGLGGATAGIPRLGALRRGGLLGRRGSMLRRLGYRGLGRRSRKLVYGKLRTRTGRRLFRGLRRTRLRRLSLLA